VLLRCPLAALPHPQTSRPPLHGSLRLASYVCPLWVPVHMLGRARAHREILPARGRPCRPLTPCVGLRTAGDRARRSGAGWMAQPFAGVHQPLTRTCASGGTLFLAARTHTHTHTHTLARTDSNGVRECSSLRACIACVCVCVRAHARSVRS